ncbi:hypothetical protein [Bradyrhizobium barranii]
MPWFTRAAARTGSATASPSPAAAQRKRSSVLGTKAQNLQLDRSRALDRASITARTGDRQRTATNGAWMMMDKIQRAILENQVILAEALWMLLHSQDISSDATLQNVSARIRATRKLLEEHSEESP